MKSKPLHVAFYMHDLSGGGVERMRLALIAALRTYGVSVSLVLGRRSGPLERQLPADLPVVDLQASRTICEVPGLIQFLNQKQPDILVSSLDHNNIAAMIAHRLATYKPRLVICQHNALSSECALGWKYRLVPLAYRVLHSSADAVIAVSRGVANEMCELAHMPRQKVSVIYNPVVGPDFADQSDAGLIHPWFVGRICPVFVFIGRLAPQKDVDTLLMAMQRLLRHKQARLILVGAGQDLARLRSMAKQRNIDHAVDFVGFQANPLPWIKNADALVSSSRYEGLGNAIIEALACGTPVISTDCPHGPAEVLLEGALGTLVPVGDFEALADAMSDYTSSDADRASRIMRAAGFTTSACAHSHIKLFNRVIAGRKRAVRALGMQVSPLSAEQVAESIVQHCDLQSVMLMVTPNIDHVRLLRRQEFASAYANAHFVCPDGFPVLLYAQLRGLHLTTRVTGCDVLAALLRHPNLPKHKIYCVVESNVTKNAALAWFESRGLGSRVEVVCARAGLADNTEAQVELVQRICAFAPTLLVLTLGAPVSEEFAYRFRHVLPPCWVLCVGQALRVQLSIAHRAPALWRRMGLEWFWRVCHEPARLSGRYARALLWFPVAVWLDQRRAH